MYLYILILTLFAIIGCEQPENKTGSRPVVVEAPAPEFVPPQVDHRFDTIQQQNAWQAQVEARVLELAAVPHPREIFSQVASQSQLTLSDLIGDQRMWEAGYSPGAAQSLVPEVSIPESLDRARALELDDEEWAAAQIFLDHKAIQDANRCAQALYDEGEFKAAAMVAARTDNLALLDRATDVLMNKVMISKVKDVIVYAVENKNVQTARHIAMHYDFDLIEIVGAGVALDLAKDGDASVLRQIVVSKLETWEEMSQTWELRDKDVTLLEDIVVLSQYDRAAAVEMAKRYLKLPHANVVLWTQCGEGCYSRPMKGTLELYDLVKSDGTYRELYFLRTQTFLNEAWPTHSAIDPNEYSWDRIGVIAGEHMRGASGWEVEYNWWDHNREERRAVFPDNALYTLMARVAASGDSQLKVFWLGQLANFGERVRNFGYVHSPRLAFEREIARGILGMPMDANAPDLALNEQYLVMKVSGQPLPDLGPLWDGLAKEFMLEWEVTGSSPFWLVRTLIALEDRDEARQTEATFHLAMIATYSRDDELVRLLRQPYQAMITNAKAREVYKQHGQPVPALWPHSDEAKQAVLTPAFDEIEKRLGKTTRDRYEHSLY